MKDPKEYGSRMLGNLLPLFPEDKREVVKAAFEAAEAAQVELGKSGLRQEDYSRAQDEARAAKEKADKHYTDLTAWHQAAKTEIDEAKKLRARIAELEAGGGASVIGADGTSPKVDLTGYMRKDEVEALIATTRQELATFATNGAATFSQLALSHYKEFGEVLPQAELLEFCRTTGLPVDRGGYDSYVGARRNEKTKLDLAEQLKAAERAGYERARTETYTASPTFGGNDAGEGGTLSGLGAKKSSADAVNAAVATYNQGMRGKQ